MGKLPGLHAIPAAGAVVALLSLGAACAHGQAAEAPAKPLTARGNEPGWSLTIGAAEIELVTDYGAARSYLPETGAGSIGRHDALRDS